DALQQTIFNIGAGMYRQAASDDSMGGDINSEMPGASMGQASSPSTAPDNGNGDNSNTDNSVSVGVVAPMSEMSPAAAAPQSEAPVFQPEAVSSPESPVETIVASATEFKQAAEEEFDIDSTVAADYEAIE
ncbi:MAG: hypothetical protein AAF528_02190, partial [Cyanobacteria bacterium P01_C01_bin.121]